MERISERESEVDRERGKKEGRRDGRKEGRKERNHKCENSNSQIPKQQSPQRKENPQRRENQKKKACDAVSKGPNIARLLFFPIVLFSYASFVPLNLLEPFEIKRLISINSWIHLP